MSGKSGGLTWNLDSAGQLMISGRGPMDDFTARGYHQSTAPWSAYQSAMVTAILKDGVTAIGQEAFSYCASLKSVMIPASVTKIGSMAFRGCAALRRVTVPNSVRRIGYRAFRDCPNLSAAHVPADTEIDPDAFDFHTAVMRW